PAAGGSVEDVLSSELISGLGVSPERIIDKPLGRDAQATQTLPRRPAGVQADLHVALAVVLDPGRGAEALATMMADSTSLRSSTCDFAASPSRNSQALIVTPPASARMHGAFLSACAQPV